MSVEPVGLMEAPTVLKPAPRDLMAELQQQAVSLSIPRVQTEFEEVPYVEESRFKRTIDMICATLGLIIMAPVLTLMALLVKLDSPGPSLYSQVRIGVNRRKSRAQRTARAGHHIRENARRYDYGGKPFFVLKFRSMHTDAESNGRAQWCTENDPRVTRMGRILRKTHLDELPQLLNILSGDMSLVGPRPERPVLIAKLQEVIPGYRRRLAVKPGITGLAQTRHRADVVLDDVRKKIRYDNFYIRKRSLPTDLGILVETVPYAFGFSTRELRRALAGRLIAKIIRGFRKAKMRILL